MSVILCIVSGLFSASVGLIALVQPSTLQGTLLISLAGGQAVSSALVGLAGFIMILLGVGYFASSAMLWSKSTWVRGTYLGVLVSIIGAVISGLATLFAPGAAAAGMVINILIITLLATQSWEVS